MTNQQNQKNMSFITTYECFVIGGRNIVLQEGEHNSKTGHRCWQATVPLDTGVTATNNNNEGQVVINCHTNDPDKPPIAKGKRSNVHLVTRTGINMKTTTHIGYLTSTKHSLIYIFSKHLVGEETTIFIEEVDMPEILISAERFFDDVIANMKTTFLQDYETFVHEAAGSGPVGMNMSLFRQWMSNWFATGQHNTAHSSMPIGCLPQALSNYNDSFSKSNDIQMISGVTENIAPIVTTLEESKIEEKLSKISLNL